MRALAHGAVILGAWALIALPAAASPAHPTSHPTTRVSSASSTSSAAASALAAESAPDGVDFVIVPPTPPDPHRAAGLSRLIYLNPCRGGCAVGNKKNDAFTNQSTVAKVPGTLAEFPFGDAAWTDLVKCVKNAYDLYDVAVTTDEPAPGTDHVEVMVAGLPTTIGFTDNTLGVSPLASDCSPLRNVISFAFAAEHSPENLDELCATVVHEAGHTFGLDHALQCRDPMTYLVACGEKLFLNIESQCGEFRKSRYCRCSDTQNSHVKLLNELGPSGRTAALGSLDIQSPTGPAWDGSQILGTVQEPRWIRSIELWINGFRWLKLPHQTVGQFRITPPGELSDGLLDVEVREVNDLGAVIKDQVTLTKGAPCQSSASCRPPETCDQGRCLYPAPTGQLGQLCRADEDCASWECLDYADDKRCATSCLVGTKASDCPASYTCVGVGDHGSGMCWPTAELPEGGCCGAAGQPPNALTMLALLAGLSVARRRRRR